MWKNNISRRTFLKSSLAAGLLASAGPLLGFEEWLSAAQNVPVQVIPTICEMCGVKCGILAYVKEGRVIKLEGNPDHPLSKGMGSPAYGHPCGDHHPHCPGTGGSQTGRSHRPLLAQYPFYQQYAGHAGCCLSQRPAGEFGS